MIAYVAFRAIHLSITYDEARCYAIVDGSEPWRRMTATHHPLATESMITSAALFGNHEWALRLPNVLCGIVYLGCAIALLRKLRTGMAVLLGFALLALNPFLVDYFSLARGYGIALALTLAALLALHAAWESTSEGRFLLAAAASVTFSAVSTYANYAWLSFHASLLAGVVLLTWFHRRRPEPARARFVWLGVAFIVGNGVVMVAPAILWVSQLPLRASLYNVETGGLIDYTLYSLVAASLYGEGFKVARGVEPVLASLLALVFLGIASAVTASLRSRELGFATLLWGILVCVLACPPVQNLLLGTLYPQNRSVLYLVPLIALGLAFTVDEAAEHAASLARRIARGIATLIIVAACVHFVRTANRTHAWIGYYDAESKVAMTRLEHFAAGADRPIRLGVSSLLEPTVNYYRVTRGYDWLLPVMHRRPRDDDDFLLILGKLRPVPRRFHEVIERFGRNETTLLGRKDRPSEWRRSQSEAPPIRSTRIGVDSEKRSSPSP